MNRVALFVLLSLVLGCDAALGETYELVLVDGRVIDPETGLDAVRNVGISNGRIAAISAQALQGETVLDVSSQVVSPGFIDLHSHSPTPLGLRYQALDGVTTSLELEAGAYPVEKYGSHLSAGAAINYGASAGHASMRVQVKHGIEFIHFLDTDADINYGSRAFTEPASADEQEAIRELLHKGLDQGGLGIGLLLDYMSEAVGADELRVVFEVAGERKAPVFVHIRRGMAGDPAGLHEVIELAKATGAPLHICHLQHSAMKGTPEFLEIIRQARVEGVDVTSEVLPYPAGTTTITAAVFRRDWQAIFDITYEDVEWAATGERFNKAMWEEYQQKYPNGMVIHHYVKEEWVRQVIEDRAVIVVTDGVPAITESVLVPPQGIGSFSRVLGRYVREEQLIDLPGALAKMTWLPARRLQNIAPVFERKGRLQVGADADITVFDPRTIIDHSTYARPYQASTGVNHVLVGGEFVVADGEFLEGRYPGRRLTGLINK